MVKYPKKLFLMSAIITLVVFLTGMILGWSLDRFKESEVLTNMEVNELNTNSYLLEQSFIEKSENVCEILHSRVGNIRYTLTKIGAQLPSSEESSLSSEANLDILKRKYFLSEVQFLLLLKDLNEKCGQTYIPILFFYTKDDSSSREQGYVLTWANEKYKEKIVILSFDKDYADEPLINTLKLNYNVDGSSAVVIGDETMEGFVGKEEMVAKINEMLA
ncbi:MAG: hypothetical protein ABIB71_06185 [Candidatus Woesearchaeota archaeon]